MFRSERVLRIICFEPVFLAFNPGACPQSHTGQGFSSCMFSCQRAKKSIVLGHFSFQFELWFFLIWSWSIPVGASKIRCSTRVFAVSKTAATDHSRHESAKCEQDSKSGSRASGSWVRIPPYPPKESSKLKGLLDFPFSRILKFPNSCVRTAYFLVENRVQIRFCYLALYSAFHNTTRMPCNRFSTSISPSTADACPPGRGNFLKNLAAFCRWRLGFAFFLPSGR